MELRGTLRRVSISCGVRRRRVFGRRYVNVTNHLPTMGPDPDPGADAEKANRGNLGPFTPTSIFLFEVYRSLGARRRHPGCGLRSNSQDSFGFNPAPTRNAQVSSSRSRRPL